MEYEIHTSNDELFHWGVRGMRWGVRRFQNKDGTLTTAGRKRYNAELAKVREEEKTLKNRQAVKARMERLEARKKAVEAGKKELDGEKTKFGLKKKQSEDENSQGAKKSVSDLSDAQLNAAVNRLRLEAEFHRLQPQQQVEKSGFMKKFVDDAVKPAAINAGKDFLQKAISKAGENLLKDKVDPNSIEALTKMRDKLKLKNEIERVKKGLSGKADDEINWVNMKNKRAYDDETAKRQRDADEAARKANEQRSQQEYDKTSSTYSRSYNKNSSTVQNGERTVAGLLTSGKNTSVLALPSSSISTGKSAADKYIEVIDKDGSSIFVRDDD